MKKFLVLFATLMLSGCFFSTKNSTFYLLESNGEETTVLSNKTVRIGVADVYIPGYLQKPQIVLQQNDSPELKISEFNRWASDLEGMVQNTLIEDLQKIMPKASIAPLMYGQNTKYVLKVEVEKMSGSLGQDAVLKGCYQIFLHNGKVFKSSKFDLKEKAGKTYASYVKTQSKLLSDLALLIAEAF